MHKSFRQMREDRDLHLCGPITRSQRCTSIVAADFAGRRPGKGRIVFAGSFFEMSSSSDRLVLVERPVFSDVMVVNHIVAAVGQLDEWGIRMLHYSYVLDKQVGRKDPLPRALAPRIFEGKRRQVLPLRLHRNNLAAVEDRPAAGPSATLAFCRISIATKTERDQECTVPSPRTPAG